MASKTFSQHVKHALRRLVGRMKWHSILRIYGYCVNDLSSAFDNLNHDFLLTKLKTYGLENEALTLICNYVNRRKQRVKYMDHFASGEQQLMVWPRDLC